MLRHFAIPGPAIPGGGMEMDDSTQQEHDLFIGELTAHRTRLYAFVRSLIHNASDAEDIFQKASVTLWRKSVSGEPPRDFVAFFCQIARGHVLDLLKQRRREKACFSEELVNLLMEYQVSTPHREDTERLDALRRCVDELPDRQRELLRQHYYDQAAVAEIAASAGRTIQGVYSSLRHTRAKLLSCITWRLGLKGGA